MDGKVQQRRGRVAGSLRSLRFSCCSSRFSVWLLWMTTHAMMIAIKLVFDDQWLSPPSARPAHGRCGRTHR